MVHLERNYNAQVAFSSYISPSCPKHPSQLTNLYLHLSFYKRVLHVIYPLVCYIYVSAYNNAQHLCHNAAELRALLYFNLSSRRTAVKCTFFSALTEERN